MKLIVFDWNGTLLADTIPSWKSSNVCLEFFGRAPISLQRFREIFHFPIIHFYTKSGISVDEMLARKEESNILFQKTYEDFAARTRTRAGARTLLESLKEQGYTCIILSNYRTEKINAHLKRLGIAHYFQYVSAHDCDGTTILQSTTKAERLSDYMVKRAYKPADTYIIGDSMEEPDIGRKLGLTSIGITDGYITRARLKAAAPDYIISHLSEIQGLIE